MSNQTYLYDFPYQPYPQQVRLMNELYSVITNRKLGIFESPTGTGKSLSVLCSSLHWLLENQENEMNELIQRKYEIKQADEKTRSELDWVEAFDKKQKLQLKFIDKIDELEKKKKLIDNINLIKIKKQSINKPILNDKSYLNQNDNEDDFLVNYDSNDENPDDDNNNSEKEGSITKIYYCSRTHSQLNQVLKELLKTNYASKIVTCSLGSRQNLCVNKSVNQLKSINLINEKCLDLQKPIVKNEEPINKKQKRSTTNKCCSFKCGSKIVEMSKTIIQNTMDIEDLFTGGIKTGGCPFYAVKQTINKAHLILMPYQNMLNPAARNACEINLKDNVIIIDEAHNLLDSISTANSVKLSRFQIETCYKQLEKYCKKYLSRLSDRNLLYIRQLKTILQNFETCLKQNKNEMKSMDSVKFLFNTHLKDIEIDKLLNYLNKSKLAFKLRNSMRNHGENDDENDVVIRTQRKSNTLFCKNKEVLDQNEIVEEKSTEEFGNAMLIVKNFLTSISQELGGKILLERGESITYLVVDPGKYLTDIIEQCRSMIVIGGTMQPFSEFSERLFKRANCSSDRIHTFSCDHVIDACKQMKVLTLGVGVNNQSLRFTYENRSDPKLIKESGELLHFMFTFSPNGAVVFFPSYDMMFIMIDYWKSNGILNNIEKIKPVFIEPKKSNQIENIMRNFTVAAKFSKGAVLFAVIGAKMSEGINFSDELARLIVIIGVPYPQKQNHVLQEKLKFIEQEYDVSVSNIMYQNLAMKAVNQAIGRAIRHKNDFAGIVLLDERYKRILNISENEIASGKLSLPKWMKEAVSFHNTSSSALLDLKKFFEVKSQTDF